MQLQVRDSKKSFTIAEFGKTVPAELQEVIDQAYLRDLSGIAQINHEWETTVREAEEMFVRSRLSQITKEIATSESAKGEALPDLQSEFAKYSRRLSELS